MKDHPDINDTLRTEGPEAVRARHDKAHSKKANGQDNAKKPDDSDIYSVQTLRTEKFPTLKQIAGDIIVEGLTLLAARPKIGKTWLALDVAIAVAQGSYCLGDIKCDQGDVLFLALEDNKRRMQRRLTKLLGINKAEWPPISCAHTWPRANNGGLDRIRKWIEQHEKTARLVVIDVLARFRKIAPPGKQSYDLDYEAIAELQKIASDTGVAIVVIHHTRKGEANDPIDAVSGTLGLAGAADAILVISRDGQGVRLYGRSRDVDEIDKAMTFSKETCRWNIVGETTDVRRSKERQEILGALVEPMKLKDIATVVGKPVKTACKLLEKMVEQGEITKPSRGVYAPISTGHYDGGGNGGGNEEPWWQR
jgi:RecA-family ATPase